jgi:hypothetical protein
MLVGMKSSLVYFAFLASFSGSSSTSSLSVALPLSVSASEIETLLGFFTYFGRLCNRFMLLLLLGRNVIT